MLRDIGQTALGLIDTSSWKLWPRCKTEECIHHDLANGFKNQTINLQILSNTLGALCHPKLKVRCTSIRVHRHTYRRVYGHMYRDVAQARCTSIRKLIVALNCKMEGFSVRNMRYSSSIDAAKSFVGMSHLEMLVRF